MLIKWNYSASKRATQKTHKVLARKIKFTYELVAFGKSTYKNTLKKPWGIVMASCVALLGPLTKQQQVCQDLL